MLLSELLTEATWTKGTFARDKKGGCVDPKSPDAVCWCLSGAFRVVCPTLPDRGAALVIKCSSAVPDTGAVWGCHISRWNDSVSWEQVANFIKRIESDEPASAIRQSLEMDQRSSC